MVQRLLLVVIVAAMAACGGGYQECDDGGGCACVGPDCADRDRDRAGERIDLGEGALRWGDGPQGVVLSRLRRWAPG